MNNITQDLLKNILTSIFPKFHGFSKDLAFPLSNSYSVFNYAKLMEDLLHESYQLALRLLRHSLQEMDSVYRNRPQRVASYYVKNTRERTIITLFGSLTYQRTIFINRQDNYLYCHVDEMLGLVKGDRYDPCVKARMVALYADHNSMIKVGRILANQIFQPFSSRKETKEYAIPRQTIQRCIRHIGCITTTFEKKASTPETLYIMADEKWIASQMPTTDKEANRMMTRCAIIFEDIQNTYKQSNLGSKQRHELLSKTRVFSLENTIWQTVEDTLFQLYDMEKVKRIHLMGDGAHWIRSGVQALSSQYYEIDFTLDSFHFHQAILRITREKEIQKKLYETIALDQDKAYFKELCLEIKEADPQCTEAIERNRDYILNQWPYILRRCNEVSMPCAMEGAISHDIANSFSSVPKGYVYDHFQIYLRNRQHHLNGANLLHLCLCAMDARKEEGTIEIDLRDTYTYESNPTSCNYKKPQFLKDIAYQGSRF